MYLQQKVMHQTNDTIIRQALVNRLNEEYAADSEYRVIPELGVWHGTARMDVTAVVNGVMHGFEIKSDRDTLSRLPDQREAYNSVFDKVTLVVGARHFVDAFKMVPEWWGIETVRMSEGGSISFNVIREPKDNPAQDSISIARLLWRHQALDLLESIGKAQGVRSKPRDAIYARIAQSVELEDLKFEDLKQYVRSVLPTQRQNVSAVQLA